MLTPHFPSIELDRTLSSLYEATCDPEEKVILVASYPCAASCFEGRYVYHDTEILSRMTVTTLGQQVSADDGLDEVQKALGAQKFSFCAGQMPVIIFDGENRAELDAESLSRGRSLVHKTLDVLPLSQRPELMFFSSLKDTVIDLPNTKLAVRLPMDALHGIPHILDPDVHYELLSKRGLALSGLRTPTSKVIDLDMKFLESKDASKLESEMALFQHVDINSMRSKNWIVEVTDKVSHEPLPFVLKMQQTIFGRGTFIIKTTTERKMLLSQLPMILEYSIRCTNSSNAHLRPGSLIISQYISSTKKLNVSFAVTFFLNRDGTHTFLCCAEQVFGESNHWAGASIYYERQDELEGRFKVTIRDVCRFLHTKGYYGAVGIDILEDDCGTQWVVDLNVRPPGSLVLGLLKGFFIKRGFREARLISAMHVLSSKEQLCVELKKELEQGRIILIAWVEDRFCGQGWASLIVAGECSSTVNTVLEKVFAARF